MAAKRRITTSIRPIRGRNEGQGGPRGTRVICPVTTLQSHQSSTHSLSNHSRISVELNSHAGTCVVGSSILVIHDHEHFVNIYGFDKETKHTNAFIVDAVIAYKNPVTHSTVCTTSWFASYNVVCTAPLSMSASSFCLLHPPRMIMPSWFKTLTAVAHPTLSHCLSTALPVTLRQDSPALQRMRTRISPSITSCPNAHHGTPLPPCTPCWRTSWLITGDT